MKNLTNDSKIYGLRVVTISIDKIILLNEIQLQTFPSNIVTIGVKAQKQLRWTPVLFKHFITM